MLHYHAVAGKPLTKEQLLPEIGAFILAGFDTSSHTIAWCL
jgi:cytochrome P450